MPIRNAIPLTFRPAGLSDALDGTNAFAGAMQSLSNLVPAPHTEMMFVPRPAEQQICNFTGINTPGFVSALLVVGDRAYGMIASQRYPGYDEPFVYDLTNQVLIPVTGVTSTNLPLSPATSGDWVPPTISMVTNSRIVITHPGYPGGSGPYIGWIDLSNFLLTRTGNVTSGSNVIRSISGATSAPIADGVQPGQLVTSAAFPAGTVVVSAANGAFSHNSNGDTHSSTLVDNLDSTSGFEIGMHVSGPGIPVGATIAAIPSGTSITLSAAATATATGVAINVSGGGTVTVSNNATLTATGESVIFAGGSYASPQYGSGNTNTNPLVAVPQAVAQFNGRAWYAVGNSVVFSDALNPTQVTNASQVLTLGDDYPITALAGLPLTSQLTGGTIQSLIAFKGAAPYFQITGDQATSNLASNSVTGSVGTEAPNTLCATPLGLAYIAPDGLRILGLSGVVTDPIGAFGKGVSVPFIGALYPSRMAMAFNQNTLRVSVQNGAKIGQPFEEYWFEFEQKIWTGPHTFPASIIRSYNAPGYGFLKAPQGIVASLFASGVTPNANTVYSENGVNLQWTWQTCLLPDNQQAAMNQVVEASVMIAIPQDTNVVVRLFDEFGGALDTLYLTGITTPRTIWGQFRWGQATWRAPQTTPTWGAFNWGAALWGLLAGNLKQYRLKFHTPIVFKQMTVQMTGSSQPGLVLGNMYAKYQPLGYDLPPVLSG